MDGSSVLRLAAFVGRDIKGLRQPEKNRYDPDQNSGPVGFLKPDRSSFEYRSQTHLTATSTAPHNPAILLTGEENILRLPRSVSWTHPCLTCQDLAILLADQNRRQRRCRFSRSGERRNRPFASVGVCLTKPVGQKGDNLCDRICILQGIFSVIHADIFQT